MGIDSPAAKPCRLTFGFEVQVPTTVNELTLPLWK